MNDGAIIVNQPRRPTGLVLLFHGVGASASDLVPVAQLVGHQHSDAMVVSIDAPHASALGQGREWFSVVGITEANRPERVARALPEFHETVAHWQKASATDPASTTLIGFSQGSIMALESTQTARTAPASRIVALAGRFATPVRRAPEGVRFHFIHGSADPVIPPRFSTEAARALQQLGATATVDLIPGLGHGIDGRAGGLLLERLASPAQREDESPGRG